MTKNMFSNQLIGKIKTNRVKDIFQNIEKLKNELNELPPK